jgi:hypothetical protein
MWLAYGGILVMIAVGVVAMAMHRDGKAVVQHHNIATLTPHEVAALIRQHPSINSPAQVGGRAHLRVRVRPRDAHQPPLSSGADTRGQARKVL